MPPESSAEWWREAVVYQIYPRSFQDSNGDGIGDLDGIIQRLDYLRDLGVDAIWLSPTFPSPMKDFGYDVSDYCGVHPDFGTLATMDRLVAQCHARGLKLLLDWVPNHSSDQHPWFLESRASRDNPKRDWYVWRDAKRDGAREGGPPNNWRAVFGGSAWEWDPQTHQYYLHSFLKEQPDLNWRNPEVVEAMHNTLRFWMDRGIDGFRIDVMGMVLKHPDMPDNPPNPAWRPGDRDSEQFLRTFTQNYADVYGAVAGIRAVLDEYPGRMAVGEVFGPPDEIARYYQVMDGVPGLHLAFNFHFIGRDGEHAPWEAGRMHRLVARYEEGLPPGAQPCYAFGNHDRSRFISRNDADGRGAERARAAALLLLGLRSTPFLYYGEEIGMRDVPIPPEQLQDPARFQWEGRDPERTPMQWDGSPTRGFSTGTPWLPYGDAATNAGDEAGDPGSMLELYRHALHTRRAEPSLHRGYWRDMGGDEDVFAFVRDIPDAPSVVVAVNTALEPRRLDLDSPGILIACTDRAREGEYVESSLQLDGLGAAWVKHA